MSRLVLIVLAIAAVSLLTIQPAGAYGGRRAEMLPPTDNIGNYSYVTCWYHSGACPNYGGNAIDWISYTTSNDYDVWQRFHVWPQDPNYYVITHLSNNYEDSNGCDYYYLDVYDGTNNSYQGTVIYYHANTSVAGAWTTEYPGRIANWRDGSMTYDSNCSSGWTGYHVHEKDTGEEWLNPAYDYYSSTTCVPGVRVCTNNNLSNVTRAFIW